MDGDTGTDIPEVYIHDIIIDSVRFEEEGDPEQLLIFDAENSTVFTRDGHVYIECTVPCSFGTKEGHYQFLVVAEGYQEQAFSVDAEYSHFDGGCPSYQWGSTELDIELDSAWDYSLEILSGTYQPLLPDSHYAVTFDYAITGTICRVGGFGIEWHPYASGGIDYYKMWPVFPGTIYTLGEDKFNMQPEAPDSVIVGLQGYMSGSSNPDPKLRSFYKLELIE